MTRPGEGMFVFLEDDDPDDCPTDVAWFIELHRGWFEAAHPPVSQDVMWDLRILGHWLLELETAVTVSSRHSEIPSVIGKVRQVFQQISLHRRIDALSKPISLRDKILRTGRTKNAKQARKVKADKQHTELKKVAEDALRVLGYQASTKDVRDQLKRRDRLCGYTETTVLKFLPPILKSIRKSKRLA